MEYMVSIGYPEWYFDSGYTEIDKNVKNEYRV